MTVTASINASTYSEPLPHIPNPYSKRNGNYSPLLHLLHVMLAEAYRYHRSRGSATRSNVESVKNLLKQVDYLWERLEGSPMEKYEFIRSRLSLILLWQQGDCSADFTRSIMNPPLYMSDVFVGKRRQILQKLQPGSLFLSSAPSAVTL